MNEPIPAAIDYRDASVDSELLPIVLAQRERALARPPAGSVTIKQMRACAKAEFMEWNRDPTPVAYVSDL